MFDQKTAFGMIDWGYSSKGRSLLILQAISGRKNRSVEIYHINVSAIELLCSVKFKILFICPINRTRLVKEQICSIELW